MFPLCGWIHLGRLPTDQQRHQSLLNELKQIMKTAQELAAEIDALTVRAQQDTARLQKIGAETEKLLKTIQDLKDVIANNTGVPPEVEAAFARLNEQYGALATVIAADDDKVPDEPETPATPAT
jgi:chromosome segregation ATPase